MTSAQVSFPHDINEVEVVDPSPPQTLNREDACNTGSSPKNLTPTSDTAASGRCHQHLGFKKGMAIASLNINGLRSHLDEVQLLIRDLGIHILALNETKLDPEFPKELAGVAGYQQERLDRTCNGGGVSIYIRDSTSTNVVLISLLMTWNSSVLRLNHQKASPFLFSLGTGHPATLLGLSISWKKFFLFWTKRVKK